MFTALIAEDPAPAQPAPSPFSNPMFMMIGLVFLFWIVVILPMTRRSRKEQEKTLASITKGSRVVTSSGIVGTVVSVKDGEDEIVIRSEETKLRVKRNTVTQVLGTDPTEVAK